MGLHVLGDFNGRRLLELCCHNGLCVTNTYFHTKPCHRVSWRHPRPHHWRQLHVIITRRVALTMSSSLAATTAQAVTLTTDLVCSKVEIQPRKLHYYKRKGRPRTNTCCIADTERTHQFLNILDQALSNNNTQNQCAASMLGSSSRQYLQHCTHCICEERTENVLV